MTRNRATTIVLQLLVSAALAFGIITTLRVLLAHGQTTPDEWFKLVIEIQRHEDQLDADEKRFVRTVINRLTSVDEVPTPDHRVWLLHLKQRLHIVFVVCSPRSPCPEH